MDELEQIMRNGIRELADEAPAGDAIEMEVEQRITADSRRARRTKLMAAAVGIAAAAAAAILLVFNLAGTGTSPQVSTDRASAPDGAPLGRGAVMVALRGNDVVSIDARGNVVKTVATMPDIDPLLKMQVTADGKYVWFGQLVPDPAMSDDGAVGYAPCLAIKRLDVASGKSEVMGQGEHFSINASGTRLALGGGCDEGEERLRSDVIMLRDLTTNEGARIESAPGTEVFMSPDGTRLIAQGALSDVYEAKQYDLSELATGKVGPAAPATPAGGGRFVATGAHAFAVRGEFESSFEIRRFAWDDLTGAGEVVLSASEVSPFGWLASGGAEVGATLYLAAETETEPVAVVSDGDGVIVSTPPSSQPQPSGTPAGSAEDLGPTTDLYRVVNGELEMVASATGFHPAPLAAIPAA